MKSGRSLYSYKMLLTSCVILVLAVTSGIECVRNTPRSARASRNEGSLEFECPEEFGYYPHPRDCTQYYVCVFGGALLESCTGGLMYSHELQTCDWPRNVGCLNGGSVAKETEEDDPLLERATKAESVELQQQHQQSRHQQRQPIQRQHQQATVTSSSPSVSQITERQHSRQRQQQQQPQQRTYVDDEYEPATEIESDRQQRVYRGQPSTIGQVQRDRDGLRRNIISVSHQPSSSSSSSSLLSTSSSSSIDGSVTPRQDASPNNNIANQVASTRRDRNDEITATRDSTLDSDSAPIHPRHDYSTNEPASDYFNGRLDEKAPNDNDSFVATRSTTSATHRPRTSNDLEGVKIAGRADYFGQTSPASLTFHQRYSSFGLDDSTKYREIDVIGDSRSILQQPRSGTEKHSLTPTAFIASQWQRSTEEFDKNEISATSPSSRQRSTVQSFPRVPHETTERVETPSGFTAAPRTLDQRQRTRNDVYQSASPSSLLRSTEELEKNEISVSPGPAGRGFMIKRLRFDNQDVNSDDKDFTGVTEAHTTRIPTGGSDYRASQAERGESRTLRVTVDPSLIGSRDSPIPSIFQTRATEKPFDSSSLTKATFGNPQKRKYYAVTIPQRYPQDDSVTTEASTAQRQSNVYSKTRKIPVNPIPLNSTGGAAEEKKYYIPSVHQQRAYNLRSEKSGSSTQSTQGRDNEIPDGRDARKPEVAGNFAISPNSGEPSEPTEKSTSPKTPNVSSEVKVDERNVKAMVITTTTTTISSSSNNPEDPARNEVPIGSPSTERLPDNHSTSVGLDTNDTEGNEIPSSNSPSNGSRGRQRSFSRGQTRRKEENRRASRPEREKDSVNPRGQTESHYRTISSESPRIAKTTVSTSSPISKSYYSDAEQSYPYYTIYDDDVSIYKDDDYPQYSVNRTVQIQQQQQPQPQLQHHHHNHHHQHQNVRIAEVTPNSNQYTQKPKKIAVNDADKYNLNPEVTVSDYDIYDNQPLKNKFRISDGQQSLRTNGLSHPSIHVTTSNAIVDNYVPLTSTTQPPPTTTVRPYTVTVQNRGRPQVNRGTAPPRLRPTLKPSTAIVSKAQEYVDIYRFPPARPGPIYPTPTVDKPAAKCRKDVCLLPDCNCGGTDIPGDYLPEEIPQIVLLTFDDSVNDLNKGLYADLFEKGRKNPNGCPISATFYVSHEWTDYSQVQNLYAAGHEIASHTVSHSFGEQFSARKWSREVAGQREILAAYGGVKLEDVRGMRAPFLSVGGNNMFKMLWDTNFTYDSSMPIYENRPPSWPYTLDYKLFHDCMIPPCPTRSYPGLWEVPMVMWQDLNGGRCSMGDACSNPPTSDGVYKMLIKNFERHYTTNRAPFGLFYHAAWFTQPHHKEGFISFLDTIVAMDDVWVVTNWQAIQWVRNPTPLQLLDRFEPFGCDYPDRPKKCNNAKVCNLWHKSGVRYMKTCQACPDIYPWTGKTGIRSSRIDNEVEN